jgi:hypothetical protein
VRGGLSARFVPSCDLYQAWLGGYLFFYDPGLSWRAEDFLKLAEADQKKWLWYYGVTRPVMDFGTPVPAAPATIDGVQGQLFRWDGLTQSDVGPQSRTVRNRVVMDGMAYIANALTPTLGVRGADFVPDLVSGNGNESLVISGYIAVMDIEPGVRAVLYVCKTKEVADRERDDMAALIKVHLGIVRQSG